MPLIECPECGEKVSDKSDACVHCGYPLKDDDNDDDIMVCPYCYSEHITPMKKGFSAGKAAAGVFTLGMYGALLGAVGSGNIKFQCASCGKSFKRPLEMTREDQKDYKERPKKWYDYL